MQACHARPLLAFKALLLQQEQEEEKEGNGSEAFIDQLLAVATASPPPPQGPALLVSQQDALLLLSRVARGYGGLLCSPAERTDRLVEGVLAGALAAQDDQHTRLQGLKVVEELLQWSAGGGGGGLPPARGAALMRWVRGWDCTHYPFGSIHTYNENPTTRPQPHPEGPGRPVPGRARRGVLLPGPVPGRRLARGPAGRKGEARGEG